MVDHQAALYASAILPVTPFTDVHTWCATPDYVPWCQRELWQRQHLEYPARHTVMAVNGSCGVVVPAVIDTIVKRQWLKNQMKFLDTYLRGRRHNASSRDHVGNVRHGSHRRSNPKR